MSGRSRLETMQRFLAELRADPPASRVRTMLDAVVADPLRHARLVNTFARLEYVGVRKMLKVRQAERLDVDGLQHAVEEAGHAVRLKRLALRLAEAAGRPAAVATFAAADTLAGEEGEGYFQQVDAAAALALADLPAEERGEWNYLLTSAAIEIRAEAFYPLYEASLRAAGAPFSVASILRDEEKHLEEMARRLRAGLPEWEERLTRTLATERSGFAAWLAAVEADAPIAAALA
ncbi:MAG TPA: hypothetical protein VGC54_03880 [Planctomycetota bacterium]